MLNLVQGKKIIVKRELKIGKIDPALLNVLFIIAILSAAVQTAEAAQVTLVPNSSTANNGSRQTTIAENAYSTSLAWASTTKPPTVLTISELNSLSARDSVVATQGGSSTLDSYIGVNFTLPGVQSVNWLKIRSNTSVSGSTDTTQLGLWNDTTPAGGGWTKLNGTGVRSSFVELTYNVSSAANIANYTRIDANKNLKFSMAVWTNGTSTSTISADLFEVTIDYDPVPSAIPPTPINLNSTQGNFWVNYTWQAGAGNVTNSYNVGHNGVWTNGTTQTYTNNSVGPHGWSNISVYAFNNSGGGSLNSTPAALNTQVANNVPVQAPIGDRAVTAGNLLTFTVSATDADSDTITYSTNATKGTLNPATGVYSWMPASSDVGTYFWSFSSSDGYGGMASNTTTVTVSDIPPGMSYINGTVLDNATRAGIGGVTVSTNTSVSTTTDATGFYSLAVTAGTYQLTAALEPVYYTNSSVAVTAAMNSVVVQDIELVRKPTGTITGSVTNG